MPANADISQRLSALIAKIEIEQNPKEFNALVEELNHLLDSDQSSKKQPASPAIDDHAHPRHQQPTANSPLVAKEDSHVPAPDAFRAPGRRTS
jgi:hypothetical protein